MTTALLSESHNLVESESNQELHSLATKLKSTALSVSINISYIVASLLAHCNYKCV